MKTTLAEVDVVAVCLPANEKPGPGDRFIVNEMAKVKRTKKVAIATKTDLVTSEQLGEHLLAIQRLGEETGTDWAEIVPVSAKSGDQVALLQDLLVGAAARRARSSTRTATSATPPRRSWPPS